MSTHEDQNTPPSDTAADLGGTETVTATATEAPSAAQLVAELIAQHEAAERQGIELPPHRRNAATLAILQALAATR